MVAGLVLAFLGAVEGPGYELAWEAAAGCPEAAHVRQELDRALADAPPREGEAVRASARIERRDDGGYVLRLQVGVGERELSSTRCEELAKATVLIVALAVDPTVLERAPLPEPELDAVTPGEDAGDELEPDRGIVPDTTATDEDRTTATREDPRTSPSRTERAGSASPGGRRETPEQAPPGRGPLHVDLGAAGSVGLSVLPRTVGVVEAIVALSGRAWRTELGLQYWTPSRQTSSVNERVGGRFQLWAIAPRGCWLPSVAPVELPLCVGVAAGAIHGRGTGELQPARRPVAAWAAVEVGGGLGWRPPATRGRLGLFVRGAVLPALVRPRFGTEQSGEIYRVPALGGRIGASIEVRLQ